MKKQKPTICVIGSGVVGQATGRGFIKMGYVVDFVDINPKILNKLNKEGFSAYKPSDLAEKDHEYDISILTVSTPTIDGKIHLNYLDSALEDFGKRLAKSNRYQLVVIRSTVPPGTIQNIVIKTIEKYSKKKVGKGFGVCMNPEYLREYCAKEDFMKPWVVVIGEYDKKSGDILSKVYENFDTPIFRISLQEAETQKYVHNIYNATKISFYNEIRLICNEIGVDPEKIFPLVAKSCEGMWNPEYGIRNFGPYSGSCLPKDTQAFLSWIKEKGLTAPLLEATIKVNNKIKKKYRRNNVT